MCENLKFWEAVRTVPKEAKKTIESGRMAGKTDINPVWRIKTLTKQFGPCGTGWYYDTPNFWLEQGANDEIAAFCTTAIHYKVGDQWSKPVYGIGGSGFIKKESKGLYTSDECYKMALTDALSVACKALGIGADVYWDKDKSKYDGDETSGTENTNSNTDTEPTPKPKTKLELLEELKKKRNCEIMSIIKGTTVTVPDVQELLKKNFGTCIQITDMDDLRYNDFIRLLKAKVAESVIAEDYEKEEDKTA